METILQCDGRDMGLGTEKSARMRSSKPKRKGTENKKRKGNRIAIDHRSITKAVMLLFFLGGFGCSDWE